MLDGKADCTFLNYYQANFYRSMGRYKDFSYRPVSDITQSISLGVTRQSDPQLLSILSKSLQHISNEDLQSILSENSTRMDQFSFNILMSKYPTQMAFAIGGVGMLIGIVVFLFVMLRIKRKQNMALEAAKAEAEKANMSENGEMVNIDGTGNRVAGSLYGHKRVYFVTGRNKIAPDLESAVARARNVAGPLNARKYDLDTPCVGGDMRCYDCSSRERICNAEVVYLKKMNHLELAEVIIIGEELGF